MQSVAKNVYTQKKLSHDHESWYVNVTTRKKIKKNIFNSQYRGKLRILGIKNWIKKEIKCVKEVRDCAFLFSDGG